MCLDRIYHGEQCTLSCLLETQVANQSTHRYFEFHLHARQNQAFYHFVEIAPWELSLNLISPLCPYNLPR